MASSDIALLKKALIAQNPAVVDDKFCAHFPFLVEQLRLGEGLDLETVLVVDTLSIWLLRAGAKPAKKGNEKRAKNGVQRGAPNLSGGCKTGYTGTGSADSTNTTNSSGTGTVSTDRSGIDTTKSSPTAQGNTTTKHPHSPQATGHSETAATAANGAPTSGATAAKDSATDAATECLAAAISPALLTCAFRFACDNAHASGKLANAVAALLGRVVAFTAHVFPALLTTWLETALALPPAHKSYFAVVEALMRELAPARTHVVAHSDFGLQCVDAMARGAVAHGAARAVGAVFLGTDADRALAYWAPLVARGLNAPFTRANTAALILPALFKPWPHHFAAWAKSLNARDPRVFLAVLRAGHTVDPHFDPFAAGLLAETELAAFLGHSDAQVRLAALTVAVVGVRASQAPLSGALAVVGDTAILSVLLRYCESPESRSTLVATLRKPLVAFKDYIAREAKIAKKEKKNREEKKGEDNDEEKVRGEKKVEQEETIEKENEEKNRNDKGIANYSCANDVSAALHRFKDHVIGLLLPDSCYSQLVLAFDFLEIFAENGFDGVARSASKPYRVFPLFDSALVACLLRFSSSNYEDIRKRASTLLAQVPFDIFNSTFQALPPQMLHNSIQLLSSLKGRQSDAAAQLFLTTAHIYQMNDDYSSFFDITNRLVQSLNAQITAGGASHGYFTTLALIFLSLKPDTLLRHSEYFSSIIVSLLETVRQIWETCKYHMALAPSQADQIGDTESWRLIKESSILLRVIISLNHANGWSFFDQDQFLALCDMIISQLTHVTHRGAFLAIFPTFVQACEVCVDSSLSDKPYLWLLANINLLETKEQLVSRRSAGLPFLITGILDAVVSDEKKLAEYLRVAFRELMRIATIEYTVNEDEKMDIPQVHAFNCMKHIFNDSTLGTLAFSFTNDALKLSLNYLDHESWAIKNSAVMLFTSLQSKLFGSSALGDTLSSTNASFFFKKFLGIKDILIEKLEAAYVSDSVNLVIPILAILTRLLTFSPSDNSLDIFVDILKEKFLLHSLWKVREMSATLLSRMLHESRLLDFASDLLTQRAVSPSNNAMHGYLLCVKECVTRIAPSIGCISVFRVTSSRLQQAISEGNRPWSVLSAYLQIVTSAEDSLPGLSQVLESQVLGEIERLKAVHYPDGSKQLYLERATTYVLKSFYASSNERIFEFTQACLLASALHEVQTSCAKFWALHPSRIQDNNDIKSLLVELINGPETWSPVKSEFLQLIISLGCSTPEAIIPEPTWPDEMIERWMIITADTEDAVGVSWFVQSVLAYADDLQPEEKIELAVEAASRFLTFNENVVSSDVAKIQFILFRKLSDDSDKIRDLSAKVLERSLGESNLCPALVGRKFLAQFSAKFGNLAVSILTEHIFTLINNLHDAIAEMQNDLFDIERTNLFINEVSFHGSLVQAILPCLDFESREGQTFEQCAVQEIQNLAHFVLTHPYMIQSWSFNVHVDTAIRKVMNYRCLNASFIRVKSELDNLHSLLVSLGYPILV